MDASAAHKKPNVFTIKGVLPVYSVFFFEAFVLGNWIPRIPDVKAMFGFSGSQLGLALFMIAFGTMFAFTSGGGLVKRFGLRNICAYASPLWALFIGYLAFAPNGYVLGVSAFFAGISVGLIEIGMNTATDKLERQSGRRLMSKAHGFWSLGSLVGAVVGAQFDGFGISVPTHFLIVMTVSAILSFVFARGIPEFSASKREGHSVTFKLPNRSLVLLCMMPIGIMLIEGAFIDWSALFVEEVLAGGPLAIGSIFAAFATVMTITRLSGDLLLDHYGPLKVARVSAASATVGIALFCTAPNVPVAFVAALFSGLGVAIFYPLVMTAAARRPGDEEDNVAAMSMFAFMSFMVAPPLIGVISDSIGLRWALALLIPLAAGSLLLTSELKKDA